MGQLGRQWPLQVSPWACADYDPGCCCVGQLRIGGQDLLMQPLKRYPGLDTEFVPQMTSRVPEDG